MSFAISLKNLRLQQNISRLDWAQTSGISRITLWRWEEGVTLPREPELEAALDALRVNPQEKLRLCQLRGEERGQGSDSKLLKGNLPLTHGGDLLAALRFRKGWTQAEVSAQTGIPRSTLTKWERMDTWPSAERLHELLFHYEVSKEELISLTVGWNGEREPLTDLEALRIEKQEIRVREPQNNELEMLSLAGRLSALAYHNEEAMKLLAETYLLYARHLIDYHRFQEAEKYLDRVTRLPVPPTPDFTILLVSVQAYYDRYLAYIKKPKTLVEAGKSSLKRLRTLGEVLDGASFEDQSHVLGGLAVSLTMMGQFDESLKVSNLAVKAGIQASEAVGLSRMYEHQWIYLDMGQAEKVLDTMPDTVPEGSLKYARFLHNRAYALRDLNLKSEAMDTLEQALEVSRKLDYAPLTKTLIQRMSEL